MESEKYLRKWINEFLDKPEPLLNNLPPCPYARNAKILFVETVDYKKLINEHLKTWNDVWDVVCIVCGDVDILEFSNDIKNVNDQWKPHGFVCLEDHKDVPETLHHLDFRNGLYNIVLLQRLEKINDASLKLHSAGYYKNWSKELYDNVVAWRLDRP